MMGVKCPCHQHVPKTKPFWSSTRGPLAMLVAANQIPHRYAPPLWVDHFYQEMTAEGVTYVAEPYGQHVDEQRATDLDFLRSHGYTIEIDPTAGKHYPGATVRIAITSPTDERTRLQAERKAAKTRDMAGFTHSWSS